LRHKAHTTPSQKLEPMPAPLMRQAGIRLVCQGKRSQKFPPLSAFCDLLGSRQARPIKADSAPFSEPITAYQRPSEPVLQGVPEDAQRGLPHPISRPNLIPTTASASIETPILHLPSPASAPLLVSSLRPLDSHRHQTNRRPADPTRSVSQTLAAQASLTHPSTHPSPSAPRIPFHNGGPRRADDALQHRHRTDEQVGEGAFFFLFRGRGCCARVAPRRGNTALSSLVIPRWC